MRCFAIVLLFLALWCSAVPANGRDVEPPAEETVVLESETDGPKLPREIGVDDVRLHMRLRMQLRHGRSLVGIVVRSDETSFRLDLSWEAGGLPAQVGLRKSDVVRITELPPQSEEETKRIGRQLQEKIARIKAESKERREARLSEETRAEEEKKARADAYRKSIDITVSEEEEAEMRGLLAEYPPQEWSEARLRELREGWILRDLPPNQKEVRFVNLFEEWKTARDTVAILDESRQEDEGDKLLMRFPPSQGWDRSRLAQIQQKEAAGLPLSVDEAQFRQYYGLWAQAVLRRAAEVEAEPATETPEPTGTAPAEEEPAAEVAPEEKAPVEDQAVE